MAGDVITFWNSISCNMSVFQEKNGLTLLLYVVPISLQSSFFLTNGYSGRKLCGKNSLCQK